MSWFIAALVVLAGACALLEVAYRRLVAKVAGHQQDVEWLAGRCDELERRIEVAERAIHTALERPAPWDEVVTDEPELAAKHDELVQETIKTAKKGEPVIW